MCSFANRDKVRAQQAVNELKEKFGGVDVLVNNAGRQITGETVQVNGGMLMI